MIRDYTLASPSLRGFLSHESLSYDGIRKPVEILRALDGPAAGPGKSPKADEQKILEQYFYDLYGVFMKRLSQFVMSPEPDDSETVRLQAMLQEMIQIKKLMAK